MGEGGGGDEKGRPERQRSSRRLRAIILDNS